MPICQSRPLTGLDGPNVTADKHVPFEALLRHWLERGRYGSTSTHPRISNFSLV